MAKQLQMKPSSGNNLSEALVVLVDGQCIKCDGKHYDSACNMSQSQWESSERYRIMSEMYIDAMVKYLRFARAEMAMGGSDGQQGH